MHRVRAIRATLLAFVATALLGFVQVGHAASVDAVEYYNSALDHYFVTANADEIAKLDAGVFVGWKRTALGFKVLEPADATAGALAVCRFYGNPLAGLDSHFYSASAAECAAVAQKFPLAWLLESDNVFRVFLPDTVTGQCPANAVPVYRSWNNRADSNHRYTTDASVHDAMIAQGYVAEGYGPGPRPVAMCAPLPPGTALPACTLSPSSSSAVAGGTVLLNAFCSGNPTGYAWTNCTSTGPQCTASSANAGGVAYTVVASNAAGAGAPASTTVTWTTPPPPPPAENRPVCRLVVSGQNPSPVVNTLLVVQSFCTGDPTSYQWSGCVSSTSNCLVRASTAGPATYTLVAANSGGTSDPASATVGWTSAPLPPAGACAQFPSALYTDVGTGSVVAYTLFSEPPAFAWDGVWVVRFTVPATAAPGAFGALQVAEFGGPPTFRDVTLSTTACDFRPTDPTGASGPLAAASGLTASIPFVAGPSAAPTAGLAPGATYYFNVRNFQRSAGVVTCAATPGRCDALANISLPR
jgi:hypothetical protein